MSKRSLEGEIIIDHRDSPGNSKVPGGTLFESALIVCSHCQWTVVLNPDRSRSRGYCPKCDKYVCDDCERIRARSSECTAIARQLGL